MIGVRLKAVNAERSAGVCRLTVQFVGEGWAVHGEHSIRGLAESRQELFNSWAILSQSAPSSGWRVIGIGTGAIFHNEYGKGRRPQAGRAGCQ